MDAERRQLSRLRRVMTVVILASAIGAAALAFVLPNGRPQGPINSYSQLSWLSALLLAYCFGTLLVPFGLADVGEPVARILKVWAVLLTVSAAIWLSLLILAPRYGWSSSDCTTISLLVALLPTLLEPVGLLKRRSRSQNSGITP